MWVEAASGDLVNLDNVVRIVLTRNVQGQSIVRAVQSDGMEAELLCGMKEDCRELRDALAKELNVWRHETHPFAPKKKDA